MHLSKIQTVIIEKRTNIDTACHHWAAAGADFHTDYSAIVRQMLNL